MRIRPDRIRLACDLVKETLLGSPIWVTGVLLLAFPVDPRIWDFLLDGARPVGLRVGVLALVVLVFLFGSAIIALVCMMFRRRYPKGLILGGTIVVAGGEFSVERGGKVVFKMTIAHAEHQRRKGAVEIHSADDKCRLLIPSRILSASDFESLCSSLVVKGYRPSEL